MVLPTGVYAALVTPFTGTGEVDFGAFPVLVDWLRHRGVIGVVVSGTTGEAASLSVEERERAIATVRECAPDLKVIAGTGCSNLPETLRLSLFAQQVGCDALVVIPPYYYKQVTEEGLIAYYRLILDAVGIPVLLYNYPELAGVHITPRIIENLLDHPRLTGVKDSSNEWGTFLSFLLRFPGLQIFSGAENLLMDAVASGSAGCISGLANAFPELIVEIEHKVRRHEDVEALNARLLAVQEAVDAFPFIPAIKQVCAWQGLPGMSVRPPLCNLTPTQAEALRQALQSLDAL